MRHGKVHRKLNKKPAHRKAMFANMAAALIKHEQIVTTLPKAKVLPVELEHQPRAVERRRAGRDVHSRCAGGEARPGQEAGVAEHFLQGHAIGKCALQVGRPAEIGIFVDPEKDPVLVDPRKSLTIEVPLQRLGADLDLRRTGPFLQFDIWRGVGTLLGTLVPVLGHAREIPLRLVEQAERPVPLITEAGLDVLDRIDPGLAGGGALVGHCAGPDQHDRRIGAPHPVGELAMFEHEILAQNVLGPAACAV